MGELESYGNALYIHYTEYLAYSMSGLTTQIKAGL